MVARQLPLLISAATAVLLLVAATFTTLSSKRSTPSELLGTQLFGSVNEFDLNRPNWHKFDYNRPDFDNALDLNLLIGKSGFFKQTGARDTSLVAVPVAAPGAAPVAAVLLPDQQLQFALAGEPVDERDVLSNEERSEAARCNGMLHACTNWMSLETGKMRVMIYEKGSWCTDDDLEGPECYNNADEIAEDHVFDIPEEGGELSQELWDAILVSCPVIEGCPKPKAFSTTDAHSVYGALPSALAPVSEYLTTLREAQAQCCVQTQQALVGRGRSLPF